MINYCVHFVRLDVYQSYETPAEHYRGNGHSFNSQSWLNLSSAIWSGPRWRKRSTIDQSISAAEANKESARHTSVTVNPSMLCYSEICRPKLVMASCLAAFGDSDVPDAPQGNRRGRAAVPLIRPGVSSISRVPENPYAFNGNELHSQQKSRHPRTRTVSHYSQGQPDYNQDVPFMQKTTPCLIWTQHATSSPSVLSQNKH